MPNHSVFYEIRASVLYSRINTFYASVEQFDCHKWQNQPLVVLPSLSNETTIGVSREAEEIGIKAGMNLSVIRKILPSIIVVPARFKRYNDVQHLINQKAVEILGKIRTFSLSEFASDIATDISIDEYFEQVDEYKDFLIDEFGDVIQSSIGIGANDFLAKLAAHMTPADGFLFLSEAEIGNVFKLELQEIPGIGDKTADRLAQFDIRTVEQLVSASPGELKQAWGNMRGEHFYHMLRGSREFDYRKAMPDTQRRMTSSKIIPENLREMPKMRSFCRSVITDGLRKARELESAVRKLSIEVTYQNPQNRKINWQYKQQIFLPEPSNSDSAWLQSVNPILESLPERASMEPSAIGLIFSEIVILPEVIEEFSLIDKNQSHADKIQQLKDLFLKPKNKRIKFEIESEFSLTGKLLPDVRKTVEPGLEKINPDVLHWVCSKYGWSRDKFLDQLLPLQLEALNFGLFDEFRNRSGLVSAPTSAGKTLIAEIRMIQRFLDSTEVRRKTVMLVPTREIGRERWQNFERGYGTIKGKGGRKGLKICYSDGDLHQHDNDIWETNFDVAILVNEKFRYFVQNPKFLLDVGEIVFDEIAFLSESVRGAFLESAILSVVSHPEKPAVLGLTHPTDDLQRILELLGTPENPPLLLESEMRPISIQTGIWSAMTSRAEFISSNNQAPIYEDIALNYPFSILETLCELLKRYLNFDNNYGEMNNVVFALPTKRMAIDTARMIAALIETDNEIAELITRNKSTRLVSNRLKGLDPSRIQRLLARILPLGIGIHSADLSLLERRIVSQAFRESEIPILICTSTMAHGVNLPAQSIVFLNWGQKRNTGSQSEDAIPFYETLKKDFIPWIGRVGRVGMPMIRPAESLYLCQSGEDSEEYQEISEVIKLQKVKIDSTIFESENLSELILFGVNTLFHRTGKPVEENAVLEFFRVSVADQKNREKICSILDNFAVQIDSEPPPVLPKIPTEENDNSTLDREIPLTELYALNRYGTDQNNYHITLLGRIAAAHGVNPETCSKLRLYLQERNFNEPLDLLDIFAIVLDTLDGRRLSPISVKRHHIAEIEQMYDELTTKILIYRSPERIENAPFIVSPPKNPFMKATLMALRDWATGMNLYHIEEKYQFIDADANLQETARDFARIIRLFGMLAQTQPGKPKLRPEKGEPDMTRIYPEFDLDVAGEAVLFGLPVTASPIARLGIDSLSRAWIMKLKSAVEQTDVSPDLPLGERLRIIADENEPFLFENLPTQGLAVRVAEALKASSRQPLGSKLRNDPSLVTEFYNHPIVAQAHVFQGKGRFTALKVMTKAGFSVFRRNEGRGKPITLRDKGDFGYWVEQRAVEFLSEIGFSTDSKTYHTDRFLIDLDPRDHFAFDDLKELVKEVYRRLLRHPWIDQEKVYINWTGGKGFHLVAEFPTGINHEVEAVRIELEPLIAALCDDVSTFAKPLTAVYQPHVVLDLSPIMKRGVYRNTFSFHSSMGGICIPIKPEKLDSFDPEQHATHSAVISVLEKMNGQKFESYQHLVSEFMRLS